MNIANMNKRIPTALAATVLLAAFAIAQDIEDEEPPAAVVEEAAGRTADEGAVASTNEVVDLSDFDAAPDGVSVMALDEDSFKLLAIATAPYRANSPTAISTARTIAVTKAKGALSRFLDERVELEDFLEKEVSKVRVVSPDGTMTAAQAVSRRVLTRIRTSSKSLLRGVVVLQTETIPSADGPGGSFRAIVGVSSATLEGSETLDVGIDRAAP